MSQQKFGRYIIKGTLGRGAMGMVYLALDPILDRLSAIKVMNTGGEVDEGLRTRFFREAKSAARLRHPNIIAIYEMGEEGKRPFIAMEYVEGEDLKALIEKRTFIPFEQKIHILVQVCEALSYAHQQGVIHRDIKPANVRIAQDGEVRILDFGLARLGSSDITRTGMLMGTPYYMSPEQVRGVRDLDGRSDLFSVAVLLYELLAYARPFEAESSTEVCLKIVSEPHIPLASVLPKVDADLVAIIDRALSKNRDVRQPDCQELARALKGYAQSVTQRLPGLEAEVARLEKEWKSCCDASQHLVELGILEESLLAPSSPSPALPIDPEETTVYNFSLEASQRDFGALLLTHARLHGRLEEVRQRLRAAVPLQELFERGQQQREQGEFQGCLKTIAEILEMVPQNARALEMQRECQQLLEEQRVETERHARLKQALALAAEALQQGNLAQCIQSASRALQIDPGNSRAQELKQQASEALVRRRKVAELLAAARGFHKAQNYESACQVCADALALDPTHAELRLIQQQSQQILERQGQIREWLKQAQEKLQAGDYLAVLGTTDQLLTLEPDLPRALEMQQQAAEALERQLKLEELVAEARGCEMAGDFEECLRVCDHALQISPENPEILSLCERASQTLAKRRRVAELLSRGRQEIERTDFALATETCREAAGLDPASRTAQELLETAEAGHRRQRQVVELFALAQSHQQQRNFQGCLDVASEALALDPGHRGHLDLQRLATDSLERLRQFQQHLETARNCDAVGEYVRSLEHLERALDLDGDNADAAELKQHVAAKLDRRNQLDACLEAARQHFRSGNYAESFESAQRALQLDKDNAEARSLHSQATEALARLEQENHLLKEAQRHLDGQEYEMAIEGADELLRLNPHHEGARTLKQEAIETQERRQRFEACLVGARNHAKSQDYSACLAAATEALEIEPQHVELRRLQEKAVQALEKERAIVASVERCRQYISNEDYGAALEAADEVLRLEPKHREAQALQRQAAEGLETQQRFEELLVLARNHSKSQNYVECLKAADEALAFVPQHPELRKLRDKAFQAVERLRAIESGLAKTRRALSEERFQEAQAAAQAVLSMESGHTEVKELARTASEMWQRQQQIEQLVEESRRKLEQRDYSAGLGAAEEGLRLKGNHAILLELHKTLKQAAERQQKLAGWIEKAQKQLEIRDYAGAIESCDQCLELEADHAEAWTLHQAASEGMERRQKVDELQATAKGYYTAKDYDNCLKSVQEALSLEPEDTDLQSLQRDARQAFEREQRLAGLLTGAERSFQERRFTDALGLLHELLSTDASHAAAVRLKEKVSREWEKVQQVEQLLGESREQASQGKWEACRKKAQEGLKLAPNHEELQQLQDHAQQELEKLRRIAELLKKARAAREERRFEDIPALAAEILELGPGHQEALDLRGKAIAALERQRQIRELLQAAQAHQTAQEPELAFRTAGEGRQLDPANAEFLSIERWAGGELERRRRVNDLLHQAQQQASDGHWEVCRNKAQEGLKLSPNHEALQQLQERAHRELEKRKRVAELLKNCRSQLQAAQFEGALALASQILELEPGHGEASELRGKAAAALEHQRRIRELFEAAQGHERGGELELALERARAGLQLEPRNTEFLSIQSRTTAALEHQHRVSALLTQARQQLNNHQYEASLRAAEELLKLEREHPEGRELAQAAASAVERHRKLNQSLAQAKAKAKSGLWEECLEAATEGLRLDPAHAELQELGSQASEILDKRRTLQELLDSGRGQLDREEHEAAIKSAERALQLGPDNVEAAQLKQQAQRALDARRKKERVARLLAEARKYEQSGDMEACYRAATEGLTLESEHVDLKALRESAGRILERRRQVQVLLERARQQWQAEDFPRVVETAVSILQLDPENSKAADFRLKAEQEMDRQRRVKELLSQAKKADKEQNHEACLRASEEGLALNSDHPELQRLQARSRQMVEQTRRMAQLLQGARAEMQAQNYAAALKTLDSALKLDSSNAEAAQLKQKAQDAWERQKRLAGLLTDAQRHLKAGQFEACLESAGQGLALEADHPLFKELTSEAQRQLELGRQIEKELARASQHLQRKEYQLAIAAYDSVLALVPGQVGAVEGRQRAHDALQRQQRLTECLARAQAAFDAEDFQSCHTVAEEGLKLEPGQPVLQDLAKKAAQIIERTRRVQRFWNEASQNQQKGDLPGCLRSLDSLLELDPENLAARELRAKIVEALERQRRVAGLLAEAASLEKSGDLEACQKLAAQALEIDPLHSQSLQFHERVSLALERRRQIQKLLEQAVQQFEEQDDAGALKILEELLSLDPAHPRGLEIQALASKRLEHRKRVEQLLMQARKAQEAGDPENCLQAAEQGLQLEPAHVEFKKLEVQSREQLDEQRKIRELVSECQRQLSASAFEASIACAQNLESLDPGNTIAAQTRQKANEGLERRQRLQSLLARARELIAAGDFAACHTICSEALEIDPSNRELLELRNQASRVLESRRLEEERQTRIRQLLTSAKASLQGGRFRAAQHDLRALLELDAAHVEARRLLTETETQQALARQKTFRRAKLAAAAVLVVSLLGSGMWYAMQILKQPPTTPPSQTNSEPSIQKPELPSPQPPPQPSKEDREVADLVDTARSLHRARKYPEAEEAAEKLLARSPNHSEGVKIQREARRSLEKIDDGLKQASALFDRGRYTEVAKVLGSVLALDADHPEAIRLMAQVDQYARSNAQDARNQMLEIKQRAAQAGAPSLVQSQYQTASSFETDAIRLFERKQFGEATGKFYEASEAYVLAEAGARKAAESVREAAAREKAAKDNSELAAKAAERQQQERDRQTAQRNQAQSAWNEYLKALPRASQAGVDRLASESYQQATSVGLRAQEKFNQGNYAGAQSDFGEALRQLVNSIARAEEIGQQRRQEEERQQKEVAQRASDVRAIQQVLRSYQGAIENKDINALKRMWPSIPRKKEEEMKVFKDSKSIRVELEPQGEPRLSEGAAVVNCRKIQRVVFSNGQRFDLRFDSKITLRKSSGEWLVESIEDVQSR